MENSTIDFRIFQAFEKRGGSGWKRKDLRNETGVPFHRLSKVLDKYCDYNHHTNEYTLKPGAAMDMDNLTPV